jgi:hypothetical protein
MSNDSDQSAGFSVGGARVGIISRAARRARLGFEDEDEDAHRSAIVCREAVPFKAAHQFYSSLPITRSTE